MKVFFIGSLLQAFVSLAAPLAMPSLEQIAQNNEIIKNDLKIVDQDRDTVKSTQSWKTYIEDKKRFKRLLDGDKQILQGNQGYQDFKANQKAVLQFAKEQNIDMEILHGMNNGTITTSGNQAFDDKFNALKKQQEDLASKNSNFQHLVEDQTRAAQVARMDQRALLQESSFIKLRADKNKLYQDYQAALQRRNSNDKNQSDVIVSRNSNSPPPNPQPSVTSSTTFSTNGMVLTMTVGSAASSMVVAAGPGQTAIASGYSMPSAVPESGPFTETVPAPSSAEKIFLSLFLCVPLFFGFAF